MMMLYSLLAGGKVEIADLTSCLLDAVAAGQESGMSWSSLANAKAEDNLNWRCA